MRAEAHRHREALALLLLMGGCASSPEVDPDIVRPAPGAPFLDKLPGPMMGPFDSPSTALLAACGKILTKPHANAGGRDHQDFGVRWRVSSEYCAWMYYTPDQHYVVSKLTDQSRVDPLQRSKSCLLPSVVDDRRYPPDAIRYIYALHNHPYGSRLTENDIQFIVSEGKAHGFEHETKDGRQRLSIVAFFSRNVSEPSCDGFHQYIPLTGQLLKWTRTGASWRCEQTGSVIWEAGDERRFTIQESSRPCDRSKTP
ncbi:hypothetical protein LY474_11980 [Myxococcus stipitatus]|uniref:hypothetical protein n=1 Tax=Myxococcus stipitatus TaxID=83455 RepID=UPI001F418A74|nr:hypothetical protein [Myxococcus stipitatus]MCE9668531.1 hypothetical protein [Myxococcus stipitatus]